VNRRQLTFAAALGMCALCVAAGFFLGRGTGPDLERGGAYLEGLRQELELSNDQVARIDGILTAYDEEVRVLVEEHRRLLEGPIEQKFRAVEEDLLAVLEPAQLARYRSRTGD
jgi:hypothetical protein